MKKLLMTLVALASAGMLYAYGVSPNQASAGGAPGSVPSAPTGAPAPNPVRLNQPGTMPGPGGDPGMQIQSGNNQDEIQKNIQEYTPPSWATDWEHIHLEDAKKWNKDSSVLFIDARAKVEYDQGHIPGSIPMPLGEFDKYYGQYESKIKAASKLVTYCHGIGCKLSDKVAQKLFNDKGHKNVAAFFGGWPQWTQANLPIEK